VHEAKKILKEIANTYSTNFLVLITFYTFC
jgi:hypothetical protein